MEEEKKVSDESIVEEAKGETPEETTTEEGTENQETKENMYSMFITYMYQTLKEIRENEKMSVENKAQMIVSLGDSFSKMGKIARQEDPEAYKLGIIKVTIEKILTSLKRELSVECMEKVIETVYEIQEELANVTI